jgi:hypothetical protein
VQCNLLQFHAAASTCDWEDALALAILPKRKSASIRVYPEFEGRFAFSLGSECR